MITFRADGMTTKTCTIENGFVLRRWYYFAWLIPVVFGLILDLRLMACRSTTPIFT